MRIFLIISTVLCFAFSLSEAQDQSSKCAFGQYTKNEPSPESDMHACKNYACNSCCTSQVTQELALVPLQVVGAMNYSQCGGLSNVCSQYMSYVQCFYQCSPNLYPWLGNLKRLNNMPMCGSFCKEWYNACANDQTCVDGQDWSRGFKAVPISTDKSKFIYQCKAGAPCRNFSQVYHGSPSEFCNTMYPGAILYTEDGSANCMNPAGEPTYNEQVVKKAAGQDAPFTLCNVSYIDTGAIIGIVIGTLAGLAIICGLIVFFVRRKNRQDHQPKTKQPESGTGKEMEELNPEPAPVLE